MSGGGVLSNEDLFVELGLLFAEKKKQVPRPAYPNRTWGAIRAPGVRDLGMTLRTEIERLGMSGRVLRDLSLVMVGGWSLPVGIERTFAAYTAWAAKSGD